MHTIASERRRRTRRAAGRGRSPLIEIDGRPRPGGQGRTRRRCRHWIAPKRSRRCSSRISTPRPASELLSEQREHFWAPGSRVYLGNRAGSYELHQEFRPTTASAVRDGTAHPRPARPQGPGAGPGAAQRRGQHPVRPVEPRLRPAVEHPGDRPGRVRGQRHPLAGCAGSPDRLLDHRRRDPADDPRLVRRRDRPRAGAPGLGERLLAVESCATAPRRNCSRWRASIARRDLPLSVIVSDYFHWTAMGDYKFDPAGMAGPRARWSRSSASSGSSSWSPSGRRCRRSRRTSSTAATRVCSSRPTKGSKLTRRSATRAWTPRCRSASTTRPTRDSRLRLEPHPPQLRRPRHPDLVAGRLRARAEPVPPGQPLLLRRARARRWPTSTRATTPGSSRRGWPRTDWTPDRAVLALGLGRVAEVRAAVWSGDIAATWESLSTPGAGRTEHRDRRHPLVDHRHRGLPRRQTPPTRRTRSWSCAGSSTACSARCSGCTETASRANSDGYANSGGPNEPWSFGDKAYEIIADIIRLRERSGPTSTSR